MLISVIQTTVIDSSCKDTLFSMIARIRDFSNDSHHGEISAPGSQNA